MKFIDPASDDWQFHEPGEARAPRRSLLALQAWRELDPAQRERLLRDAEVGLLLPNDLDVETLQPDLAHLRLLALRFPRWTDGRAYTQARLLRLRLRFPGEIRAVGEVLVDMVLPMARSGFDSAVLREDQDERSARHALEFFPGHYQIDARRPPATARPGAQYGRLCSQALDLLRQAAAVHPGAVVQSSSLGAEDMVLTDLIQRHGLDIRVATLDTGVLHAQTLDLIQRVRGHYGIDIEVWRPSRQAVVEFVGRNGSDAMYRSVQLRHACCALRKLEPLGRMLQERSAWVTGLRREQSAQRAAVQARQVGSDGRVKYSPLVDWSLGDVWQYIVEFEVPYNPLHDQFYPSIGCAPCTRAVALGEEQRAGRWWWERDGEKECGLHVQRMHATTASAS